MKHRRTVAPTLRTGARWEAQTPGRVGAHEARKNQKVIVVKEVKFSPNTDEHDYEFKKNNILRFLKEGDKVKAVIFYRGREISHSEIGAKMMKRLIEEVAEAGVVEYQPRMEGRTLIAIFAPKK